MLIASAVAEKLSALETAEFFAGRARRADFGAFDQIMNRPGGEAPSAGDEPPKGYKRRKRPGLMRFCVSANSAKTFRTGAKIFGWSG